MLSNIGNILIIINILICISLIYISFENLKKKNLVIPSQLYNLTIYQTTVSIVTFFTLVAGFIISDFKSSN